MTLESNIAIRTTQILLGIGVVFQSVEILASRHGHASLCAGNRPLGFSKQWLTAKMIVRLALASVLICGFGKYLSVIEPVFYLSLIISTAGLILRFGGPLGGGSDSMLFQVLIGLLVASFSVANPGLTRIGLGWIAAQSVLSYFLAGAAKLRNKNWRRGIALEHLLRSSGPYVLFAPARNLAGSKKMCIAASWAIILFELVFPVVLLLPWEGKLVLLSAGMFFHITNAAVLGLNRFIWAWAATYPAVLYFN